MALKIRRRAVVLAVAAIGLPLLAVGLALPGFSRAASLELRMRRLPVDDHNAIKHAYAAAEIYSFIRIFAGPAWASRAVVRLGELNEWAEGYVKHSIDWSPEVYKDLRNNLTGIAAAEWLYGQAGYKGPFTRLHLIGKLAEDGVLAAIADDPRIPSLPERPDTPAAMARMKADHAGLAAQLAAEIAAKSAALKADLQLD